MARKTSERPRTQIRIGAGEFYDPARPSEPCAVFLEAVRRLVPEVFVELEALLDASVAPADDMSDWHTDNPRLNNPELKALAERRGLSDEPVFAVVATSLRCWGSKYCFQGSEDSAENRQRPRRERRRSFYRRTWYFPSNNESRVEQFESPDWEPLHDSEEQFRQYVEDYITETRRAWLSLGYVPVREKRGRPGETPERHFEWLALYNVGRLTLDAIAQRYPPIDGDALLSRPTILAGIRSAASAAGMRIRRR